MPLKDLGTPFHSDAAAVLYLITSHAALMENDFRTSNKALLYKELFEYLRQQLPFDIPAESAREKQDIPKPIAVPKSCVRTPFHCMGLLIIVAAGALAHVPPKEILSEDGLTHEHVHARMAVLVTMRHLFAYARAEQLAGFMQRDQATILNLLQLHEKLTQEAYRETSNEKNLQYHSLLRSLKRMYWRI